MLPPSPKTDQLTLMQFSGPTGAVMAYVILGHLPKDEFMHALTSVVPDLKPAESEIRYEYAWFGANESILANASPRAAGVRQVTIYYPKDFALN